MVRVSGLIFTLLFLLAAPALAQNGKLVDSTPVTFDEATLARLETTRPGVQALAGQIDIRTITYMSDGLKVKGYLVTPKTGEKLPCVIYNRGGNREFGAWTNERALGTLGKLASWGYVVVASQYRGNGGSEGREEFGGADVNDVLNLIPLLESLPLADATRIGMYGWSRGGMMTYLTLARTDRIAAAVVGSGMADMWNTIERRPDMESGVIAELIPDFAKNRDAAITARSAVRWADKLNKSTPILLLHGSADWRVYPEQAMDMASALLACKHPFRLVMLEGGQHSLVEHRGEVDRQARTWLDTYVRDRTPWPSLEPHGE